MRVVSSSDIRTRFDRAHGARDERDEGRGGVEASDAGAVGGDHAILELRRS